MGVSGCGKTTLGELLGKEMGWEYFEADGFHPEENIKKMSSGISLTDDDRWPWLEIIRNRIKEIQNAGDSAVFSCSALKESYRSFLVEGLDKSVEWVYLKGSYETIHNRMSGRKGHYFKAEMLKSQFADLEEPAYGEIMDIEVPLEEKVAVLAEIFKRKLGAVK